MGRTEKFARQYKIFWTLLKDNIKTEIHVIGGWFPDYTKVSYKPLRKI